MRREKINVLQITIGSVISPSLIKAIKDNGEREICLVGVDGYENACGRFFVDRFYKITESFVSQDIFIEQIINIICKEKIDLVLPGSDEDALAITRHAKAIESLGAKVVSSPYEVLQKALDKSKAYATINKINPSMAPRYFLVSSYEQFLEAAIRLGYPKKRSFSSQN